MKPLILFISFISISAYADVVTLESSQQYTTKPSPSIQALASSTKVSNLRKYYKPNPAITKNNIDLVNSNGKVEIINSSLSTYSENVLDLYENQYILMGESEFNDRKLSEKLIKNYAKEVGASVVVVVSQGVTYNPYSESDDLNELDTGYLHHISFFGKTDAWNKPNMLGIQMSEIPRDKKILYQRNTGTYVSLVLKESRAYYSNILVGDVIIALNGFDTFTPESLNLIKDQELKKAKTLNLIILRVVNGTVKEFQIPVHF